MKKKPEAMQLLLGPDGGGGDLRKIYQHAFKQAVELYIVSAYLTSWDTTISQLKAQCKQFFLIVGKDFGITRKDACRAVQKWLPSARQHTFLVTDKVSGFHPKGMFWRDVTGACHMLIGSSNLTVAAFDRNIEANVYACISAKTFEQARKWVDGLKNYAVPVNSRWLDDYHEARQAGGERR